jgi:dihydroorotase
VAEEIAVARDLLLAASVGGRLHVQHLSTAGAVELAREAKAREVWVTAEVTPHHFTLNHEAVARHGTNAKMSPPLREEQDRLALIAGLRDGTIDAIATDHAPHAPSEKEAPFAQAPNGIIGAQTALPLALDLWRNGTMSLAAVIARLTSGPAGVLGLPCGTLTEGAVADVTLIDPDARWTLDADSNLSKSRNSPWWGVPLRGRAEATIVGGKVVYRRGRNPVWCRSQGSGR